MRRHPANRRQRSGNLGLERLHCTGMRAVAHLILGLRHRQIMLTGALRLAAGADVNVTFSAATNVLNL